MSEGQRAGVPFGRLFGENPLLMCFCRRRRPGGDESVTAQPPAFFSQGLFPLGEGQLLWLRVSPLRRRGHPTSDPNVRGGVPASTVGLRTLCGGGLRRSAAALLGPLAGRAPPASPFPLESRGPVGGRDRRPAAPRGPPSPRSRGGPATYSPGASRLGRGRGGYKTGSLGCRGNLRRPVPPLVE